MRSPGVPDCQSGAVHSVGCGTIIRIAAAGDSGVICRSRTVDNLASITLAMTARLIGSERAWAGTTRVWRSLKGPGYLGLLSRTASLHP